MARLSTTKARPTIRNSCLLFLIREQLNMNQLDMAEEIKKAFPGVNITANTISNYENRELMLSPTCKIINAYVGTWTMTLQQGTAEGDQITYITQADNILADVLTKLDELRQIVAKK